MKLHLAGALLFLQEHYDMSDSRVSYVGASAGGLLVVLAVRTPHSRLLHVASSNIFGLHSTLAYRGCHFTSCLDRVAARKAA